MNLEDFNCNHACRNMCAALNEALRAETKLTEFYERMEGECDYPDIHRFMHEIVEERRQSILRIVQKLNEMYARGEALDGIQASFGENAP
ncbi:MAG TPA: hypothetical protein VI704_06425 [Bacteroidota bacterium]|nr:hypothetical protein [Bacteroidota bacterium]